MKITERLPGFGESQFRNIVVGIAYLFFVPIIAMMVIVMFAVTLGFEASDSSAEVERDNTPELVTPEAEEIEAVPEEEEVEEIEVEQTDPAEDVQQEAESEESVSPEFRAAVMEQTLTEAGMDVTVMFGEGTTQEVWIEYYPTGTTTADHMSDIAMIAGAYAGVGFEHDALVVAQYPNGEVMADFIISHEDAASYMDGTMTDEDYLDAVLDTLEAY